MFQTLNYLQPNTYQVMQLPLFLLCHKIDFDSILGNQIKLLSSTSLIQCSCLFFFCVIKYILILSNQIHMLSNVIKSHQFYVVSSNKFSTISRLIQCCSDIDQILLSNQISFLKQVLQVDPMQLTLFRCASISRLYPCQ